MIVLGFDCALKTGWCLVRKGLPVESGVGEFVRQRGESNGIVFLRFRRWVSELANASGMFAYLRKTAWTDPCGEPLVIAYEQAHHRGGAATEIAVGMSTRLQEIAAELGAECLSVHTATLKKWATGNGRAEKTAMVVAAHEKGHITPSEHRLQDDEAEAILVALWAWTEVGK